MDHYILMRCLTRNEQHRCEVLEVILVSSFEMILFIFFLVLYYDKTIDLQSIRIFDGTQIWIENSGFFYSDLDLFYIKTKLYTPFMSVPLSVEMGDACG